MLAIFPRYLKKKRTVEKQHGGQHGHEQHGAWKALQEMGAENVITDVGDRYVMEEMRKQGAILGGEESATRSSWNIRPQVTAF